MSDGTVGGKVTIGGRIKKERRYKGFSQRGLAGKIGKSNGTISRIENNKNDPGLGLLLRISELLGVDFHEELAPNSRLDKEMKKIINKFGLEELEFIRKGSATQIRKNTLAAFKKIIEDHKKK